VYKPTLFKELGPRTGILGSSDMKKKIQMASREEVISWTKDENSIIPQVLCYIIWKWYSA
jgi:hypothetical protein